MCLPSQCSSKARLTFKAGWQAPESALDVSRDGQFSVLQLCVLECIAEEDYGASDSVCESPTGSRLMI